MAAAEKQTTKTTPEEPVEENEETASLENDSPQTLLQEIIEAQGSLADDGMSVKRLTKHLRSVLYPLLGRSTGMLVNIGDTFQDIVDSLPSDEGENISSENAQYVTGYIDTVNAFVHKWMPEAQRLAQQNQLSLLEDLTALYQGGKGVKEIVQLLSEEIGDVEEEDDDGQG